MTTISKKRKQVFNALNCMLMVNSVNLKCKNLNNINKLMPRIVRIIIKNWEDLLVW